MRAIKKRGGEKTNFLLLFLLTISTIQWQISLFVRVFEDASTLILYSYFPKLIEIIEIVIGQSIFSDLNFALSSDNEFSKIRQLRCQLIFQN